MNDLSVEGAVLFVLFGAAITAAGIAYWRMDRLFRFHYWRRVYHHNLRTNPDARWVWGCMLPIGVAFLLLAAGGLLSVLALPDPFGALIGVLLGFTGLAALGAWIVLVIRRRSVQPGWMRDEMRRERAGLPSVVPFPPEGERQVVSRWMKRLAWIWVAFLFVAAVPAGRWLGIGTTFALLLGAATSAALVVSWETRD